MVFQSATLIVVDDDDAFKAIRYLWLFWSDADQCCGHAADNAVDHDDEYEKFSKKEFSLLMSVCVDSDDAFKFWNSLKLMLVLASWASKISGWLHGCLCHEPELMERRKVVKCVMKGRRAAEFAGHKLEEFKSELKHLTIPQNLKAVLEVSKNDSEERKSIKAWLQLQFFACRN
eukprot:9021879-Karenia_brevis.AAC.1